MKVKFNKAYGHQCRVHAVSLSDDGTAVIAGDEYGYALVWDINPRGLSNGMTRAIGQPVKAAVFQPGSKDLYAVASGSEIILGGRAGAVTKLRGHTQTVTTLAYGPDKLLASGGLDGKVCVWRVLNEAVSFQLPDQGVRQVAWSPDGKTLYAAAGMCLHAWDTKDWRHSATLVEQGGGAMSATPVGDSVWVGLMGGDICEVGPGEGCDVGLPQPSVLVHRGPSEARAASAWIRRTGTRRILRRLRLGFGHPVGAVDVGTGLFIGTTRRLFFCRPGEARSGQDLSAGTGSLTCLTADRSRKTMVSGNSEGAICLWNLGQESIREATADCV